MKPPGHGNRPPLPSVDAASGKSRLRSPLHLVGRLFGDTPTPVGDAATPPPSRASLVTVAPRPPRRADLAQGAARLLRQTVKPSNRQK